MSSPIKEKKQQKRKNKKEITKKAANKLKQESKTNTLKGRIKDKHNQINKGGKRDKPSSVIVTLFSQPKTVKELHK